MQIITISGNIGRDPELRRAGSDDVLSFSVGVKQGWGDKASTNWFRCNVWGKRAGSLKSHLSKGDKVFVAGELSIGVYDGKPQYDVRVSEVDFASTGGGQSRPLNDRKPAPRDDLDDDVPF